LFLEELTKALLERGDRDNRTSGALGQNPAIPATLHASLIARLDRLGPMAREAAQIGAVIGRAFDYELVERVVQRPASELREALDQLAEAGLLFCRGVGQQSKCLFKHALIRDAAYSTLLRGRRQQLHAHVAEALQGQFREVKAQPELLAHHCTEAGLTEQAIAYWLAAGRQAWRRSATEEAVALLRRGLALVSALPDSAGRQETELDLRIALGQALTANRGWGAPELAEIHSRARELASMLNRPRALLLALWGQFMSQFARADLKRARRFAAELLALGEAAGDVLMQVMGSHAIGLACFQRGEFTAGRAYLDKGLVLANPAHRGSIGQQLRVGDARIQLRIVSSRLLACFGRLDQALFHSDAALDDARRLSHPQTLAAALAAVWITRWLVRLEPGSLLQYANELLASATEHGLGLFRASALVCRGWCLVSLGRADEGISLLTAGLAASDELGIVIWRPCILTLLGDARRIAGQWPAALGHLTEAWQLAEETEDRWCQAETTRLRGDVLAATGDRTGAEASYHEAIAIAQQQSAKLWELRAAVSLARLSRDQIRRADARDLLAPVYDWFTEGFDTADLKEAKALLDELT
jgi:predicted ATPase